LPRMRIIETESGRSVSLEQEALRVLHQALNEVCNGPDAIEAWEFPPRIGVERDEALALLKAVGSAYDTWKRRDEADALYRAWQEAATDLGVTIRQVGDAVLVSDFGSEGGMLCAVRRGEEEWSALRDEAEPLGAGSSSVGTTYLRYDRESYIDMLSDWGWCGGGAPP